MKKIIHLFREFLYIMAIAILISLVFWTFGAYMEMRSCICFGLSHEIQERPIDEKLGQVYPMENLRLGAYSILITQCRHGKRMRIMVDPDYGIYKAQLL